MKKPVVLLENVRSLGVVFPSHKTPSTAFAYSFVTQDKDLVLDNFVVVESDDIVYVGQVVEIQTINPSSELSKELTSLNMGQLETDPKIIAMIEQGRGGAESVCDLVSVSVVYTRGINGRTATKR